MRRSGTSFYWAMRLLPAEKREAMFAVYAFCREVDDIADEPGEMDDEAARSAGLARRDRASLRRRGRTAGHGGAAATGRTLRAAPKADFLAVIDGMEMDAMQRASGSRTWPSCTSTAIAWPAPSAACRCASSACRSRSATAWPPLRAQALQLTNILRDLKEDASRDRLYLPDDLLRERRHRHQRRPMPRRPCGIGRVADVCEQIAAVARAAVRRGGGARRSLRPPAGAAGGDHDAGLPADAATADRPRLAALGRAGFGLAGREALGGAAVRDGLSVTAGCTSSAPGWPVSPPPSSSPRPAGRSASTSRRGRRAAAAAPSSTRRWTGRSTTATTWC